MAGAKNHDYHILPPSIWPFMGAMAALALAVGGIMWMHKAPSGGLVFYLGLAGVLATMFLWWRDVIKEAHSGDHTPVVQLHLRYGMILFIASEVMFFVGWFWAFFDFSLFPAPVEVIGGEVTRIAETVKNVAGQWPPKGLEVISPWGLPLVNTVILLLSGTTVTWAHHALIHGDRDGLKKGLWITIALGALFSLIQGYEYAEAPFHFAGLNFGASFFMATGFHGFHVLIGTIFLIVCQIRVYQGHFTPRQHFGFEAAAWYWHFVDVVWLFLFVSVYVWGGAGAPVHGG
ncbi:MAG: cytochrome c oxidase subunit 3 [Sphingomonas sp. 28-62-20]|uniref:cytochrome c oxidase subunit 3 n=1 Tax=unclassified Sphingomonas TaxID=196159 RepID=UPI000BC82A96|nr:cytochrome c oxidase subunit 3 [Sphingomonas sp.]OYY76686.1 MAG: cytochrome c oxidase subunit 3 [Sphingomonas sp. 28-62-20]